MADIKIHKVSIDEIIEKRNSLQKELYGIYSGSPKTSSKAYTKASKALKQKQEYTLSDDEIDAFLPKDLKRKPIV